MIRREEAAPQTKHWEAASALSGTITPDELQLAVEKALDKKLEPVIKMLAESRRQTLSVQDILGGIGYILGLVGIASYFHFRKNKGGSQAP